MKNILVPYSHPFCPIPSAPKPASPTPTLNLSSFYVAGLIFTKGLRLSQVLGLNPVLKSRLLSQLSFVLQPYSQRVT